ncbi:uncharacterized protein PV07_12707 [Cladophialophora immunda]|uniref:Uncharacterized protein n=1 Tax=Cladophialophora immunda TaxID=569365 RepID=A0A0D2BS47_9EURO|nr:uncharacterized protein PV07_12707 [Cladophialophora immunda]KIW21883.1 hypothetical protein PV07_12707 [Cladophialophora immunda]
MHLMEIQRQQSLHRPHPKKLAIFMRHFHWAIGGRVTLTENIWIERGLVDGALSTVRDIFWKPGANWQAKEPPIAILVCFDHYNGPAVACVNGEILTPIFRSRHEFYRGAAM